MTVLPTPEQRLAACERPRGPAVMHQQWSDLLFLHWPIDAETIANRLPPGLHVDTHGGQAWIGVVPFFMNRIRPTGLIPLPWLSWFLELNVRTYVHDENGVPGVWFFSLDCNQPVAVEIARRLFHLPYQHASMQAVKSTESVDYRCRRKREQTTAEYRYETSVDLKPASPGSLEWFLVERYVLFSVNPSDVIFQGRVHHTPYQIAPGGCSRWSAGPLEWNGFPVSDEPPASILTAAPLEVDIFPLRRSAARHSSKS